MKKAGKPSHLKVIRPTLKDYTKAMDYQTYQISDRSPEFTEKDKKTIDSRRKKLKIEMQSHEFKASDPIQILYF